MFKFLADYTTGLNNAADNIPKNTDIDIISVLNWVYAFAGVVAVGFIVYGAVNYAMTQGDPGKIKQAGQTIAYAVIGLVVVLLAAAITNFIAIAAVGTADQEGYEKIIEDINEFSGSFLAWARFYPCFC